MALSPVDWFYLLTTLLLLLLSGYFSSAEIGLLSVNRFRVHQLAEDGSARAALLQRLIQQPQRPLTVILILITTLNYLNESLVTEWLHIRHGFPEWVPFVSLLVLVLILAEITPINYAAANPEIVALGSAPIIERASRLLRPLVSVFTSVANYILRLFGGKPPLRPFVTGEEVRTIVDIETERGVLEEEEKELIHSIFDFSDTVVREVMVPRIDIIAVSEDTTLAAVIETTIDHRFSRLPVYQGNIDHIVGLVHVKELLPYELRQDTGGPVAQVMHPAAFVPETKSVSALLREFRESKQTLAIVLDEYGGTAGLVTVEDLLEEIVGEIYDEYDLEQKTIEWIDRNTVVVDAKIPIDEADELLDHELPRGEYDTIGGLMYSRFGDVPSRGEAVDFEGFRFIIEHLDGHRIIRVRIIRLPAEDGSASDLQP